MLAIGPLHALKTGRTVANHLLRRDLGIWTAITGLLHLAAATAVVMTPAYFRDYIRGPASAPLPPLAGWTGTASIVAGYVIGLVFILLLFLSSDRSLRGLGPERWKRLQRNAGWAFWLTAAHGLVFQAIEGRTGSWSWTLLGATLVVLWLRLRGRRAVAATRRVTARTAPD